MAAEVGKFIEAQLRELPEDHPDRVFLKEELERFLTYNPTSEVARQNLKNLLTFSVSPQVVGNHMDIRDYQNNELGRENTIVNLLPAECLEFTSIIYGLIRTRIDTRKKLMDLTPDGIKSITGIGEKKRKIVLAMRDLARAEAREQSSPN